MKNPITKTAGSNPLPMNCTRRIKATASPTRVTAWLALPLLWAFLADSASAQVSVNWPGGRYAITCDGNADDKDDWGGTPFAIAMMAHAGLMDKVVHVEYNNNYLKPSSTVEWQNAMRESSEGALTRFGGDVSISYDVTRDYDNAMAHFLQVALESTSEDPLWLICAGPMEIPYRHLQTVALADRSKLQHIHCISHSVINQTYADIPGNEHLSYNWDDIAADFPEVHLHTIDDQNINNNLNAGFKTYESYWDWLTVMGPEYVWLHSRNQVVDVFDISDAGMTFWLLSGGPNGGDEQGSVPEVRDLFQNPRDVSLVRPTQIVEPVAGTVLDEGSIVRLKAAGAGVKWFYDADDDGKDFLYAGTGNWVEFTLPDGITGNRQITFIALGESGSDSVTLDFSAYSPPPEQVWVESGGIVVIEPENYNRDFDLWEKHTNSDVYGFLAGFLGDGAIIFKGNTVNGGPPTSVLEFKVLVTNPGVYAFGARGTESEIEPKKADQGNDCYLAMDRQTECYDELTKFVSIGPPDTWNWDLRVDCEGFVIKEYELLEGIHTLRIAGRSKNFVLDRFVMYRKDLGILETDYATMEGWLESERREFSAAGVPATGMALESTGLTLAAGEVLQLPAAVFPANATNRKISWSSSDLAVATVHNGVITAVSAGVANILAETDDGGFTDNCLVTVSGTAPGCIAAGFLSYEKWNGIIGAAVTDLTNHPNYPDNPDETGLRTRIFWNENLENNIGIRFRGLLCPPATGEYTFWITGNNHVQLSISTDSTEANKQVIAHHMGQTDLDEWNTFPEQKSGPIFLQHHQPVYIEAIVKDGWAPERIAVGWLKPGEEGYKPSQQIPGTLLSPFNYIPPETFQLDLTAVNGSVALSPQKSEYLQGERVMLTATADPAYYFSGWSGDLSGETNPIQLTMDTDKVVVAHFELADDPVTEVVMSGCPETTVYTSRQYQLTATVLPVSAGDKSVSWSSSDESVATVDAGGVVTALAEGTATITVTTHDGGWTDTCLLLVEELQYATCSASGYITYQKWNGIPGKAVSDLTSHPLYPDSPDETGTLTQMKWDAKVQDNFGLRMVGFVCMPATGEYTFWVGGDDHVELHISADANPANKVLIAYHTDYNFLGEWNKYPTQKSESFHFQETQMVYIEAILKENTGGERLHVGWLKPGEFGTEPSEIIPGSVLDVFPTTAVDLDGDGYFADVAPDHPLYDGNDYNYVYPQPSLKPDGVPTQYTAAYPVGDYHPAMRDFTLLGGFFAAQVPLSPGFVYELQQSPDLEEWGSVMFRWNGTDQQSLRPTTPAVETITFSSTPPDPVFFRVRQMPDPDLRLVD